MNSQEAVVTGVGVAVPGVPNPFGLLASEPPAVADDPVQKLTGRGLRYKDRATKLAMVAAGPALTNAGLLRDGVLTVPGDTVGVVVSSNLGNIDSVCETVETIKRETVLGTSPMLLPNSASNVIASWLAITYGLRAANLTLCNGPTSGLDALHWARLMLCAGRARHVLVVGVEPDNAPVRHVLSVGDRADVRLLDGSAALVVETAETAAARRARPLARLGAYARGGDHEAVVERVREEGTGPYGLWCVPEPSAGTEPGPGLPHHERRHDVTAVTGQCSGALGVVQCVAAVAWLTGGGNGAVLATAGRSADDDAAAALVLTGVGDDQ